MKDLAIMVPYRDREEHLKQFIPYMKNYLTRKGFSFDFYIIEQEEGKQFNRGTMKNIGYDLASKRNYATCVFHDIDMLPVNVEYGDVKIPTHLSSEVEQFGWKLPMNGTYEPYFGGIVAFPFNAFGEINGYSNEYWGWGAEDDDLLHRVKVNNFEWTRRYPGAVRSLKHDRPVDKEEYQTNLSKLRNVWDGTSDPKKDGLNTLSYEILEDKSSEEFFMYKVRIW